MKTTEPFIITISRQLGSGGSYIGQQLAKNMNILYFDREIISEAATKLAVTEEELETIDEKAISFIRKGIDLLQFGVPEIYIPPRVYLPTDRELFNIESQIIKHIAEECSSVIIGRCASYVLQEKPNHISIFLHADIAVRKKRVQELYNVEPEAAVRMIKRSDTDRSRYCIKISGEEWADANNYNLCIDTGKIGLDSCLHLVMDYIKLR